MTFSQIKLTALSSLGGALEFFDFVIYILFANYISQVFFPNSNSTISLLNTYVVFAIGYIGRPFGSVIFGHVGDRIGRKSSFTLAAFAMAISTVLIGCLPSYQQVGIIAPSMLILLRIIQGISLGGEIGGSTVFVMEHVPQKNKGFAVGLLFMAISFGNVIGSIVAFLLSHLLDEKTLASWGWRIPFWIGFVLSIVAYFIRKRLFETPEFTALIDEKKSRFPLLTLIRTAFPQFLIGVSLTAVSGSTFSLLMYLPSYMSMTVHTSLKNAFFANLCGFLVVSIFTPFFGFISDYIGRKQLMIFGALVFGLSAYSLFQFLLTTENLLIFSIALAFIATLANGCYGCAIAELFPTEIRYTGMALAMNVGVAIFAGITPTISMLVFRMTHFTQAPVYYLIACGAITLIGASFMQQTKLVGNFSRNEIVEISK